MATDQRYHCSRCGNFSQQNTAAACVACGTDTDMVLIDVTPDVDGSGGLTISVSQKDPRRQHQHDPRRQVPQ